MRLLILRNLSKPFPDYREGDVREVEAELADKLVKKSLAVETEDDLTPLDKKTGQRKGAEASTATDTRLPVDTDAPTDPRAGDPRVDHAEVTKPEGADKPA